MGTKSMVSSRLKSTVGVTLPGSSCRHEIDACGHEELYMLFDSLQLINFYKTFGFVPIPGDQLPKDDPGVVPVLLRRDGRV